MIVLRLAAEQPQRVTHVVTAGGFAESLVHGERMAKRMQIEGELMQADWPGYLDYFMSVHLHRAAFDQAVRRRRALSAGPPMPR